jgi:methyltransferase (TIGR00027 family)
MERDRRSRTIEIPAIHRALHQTLDDPPKILDDPISAQLLDSEDDGGWLAPFVNQPDSRLTRAGFVLRARYAEDCLAEAVERGVRQYIVLGAGLDTFAYRQPSWADALRIYEVDELVTQRWKRDRLKAAGIDVPSNVRFVPVDFEQSPIPEALAASDFSFDHQAFCSWMGVTQYLSEDAIEATFGFILSLTSGSQIVFSILLPHDAVPEPEATRMATAARRTAEVGEPWLTRRMPDKVSTRLRSMGFSDVVDLTPEQARDRYFRDRTDGLRERHGERLMLATV